MIKLLKASLFPSGMSLSECCAGWRSVSHLLSTAPTTSDLMPLNSTSDVRLKSSLAFWSIWKKMKGFSSKLKKRLLCSFMTAWKRWVWRLALIFTFWQTLSLLWFLNLFPLFLFYFFSCFTFVFCSFSGSIVGVVFFSIFLYLFFLCLCQFSNPPVWCQVSFLVFPVLPVLFWSSSISPSILIDCSLPSSYAFNVSWSVPAFPAVPLTPVYSHPSTFLCQGFCYCSFLWFSVLVSLEWNVMCVCVCFTCKVTASASLLKVIVCSCRLARFFTLLLKISASLLLSSLNLTSSSSATQRTKDHSL